MRPDNLRGDNRGLARVQCARGAHRHGRLLLPAFHHSRLRGFDRRRTRRLTRMASGKSRGADCQTDNQTKLASLQFLRRFGSQSPGREKCSA